MKYAISDLHGRYDRYEKVLERITEKDELFVLGDCIDRGKDGVKILLDIQKRDNVHLIIGNHEDLLLNALAPYVLGNKTLFETEYSDEFDLWLYNGGGTTYKALEQQGLIKSIFKYLYEDINLYATTEVNGEKIYLGHASVLDCYKDFQGSIKEYLKKDLPEEDYRASIWDSPFKQIMGMDYGFDKYVFGHKFVQQFGTNKMYVKDNMYDIDGGCAIGTQYKNSVILLCLDTMKPEYIYASEEEKNLKSYNRYGLCE